MAAGQGYSGSYVSPSQAGGDVNLSRLYIAGFQPEWVSNSTLSITAGACRDAANTGDISTTAPLAIDITATGAGGRNVDTAEQSNKWYAVLVIKNPTTGTVAGFLVNEDDIGAYTLPAGYTQTRRVGWFRNNNSGNLRKGRYIGAGLCRLFYYDVSKAELYALSGGSAIVFTNVDLSEWVPPDQVGVQLNMVYDPFGTSYVYFRPDGSSVADPAEFSYEATNPSSAWIDMYTSSARIIEYKCANASDSLEIFVPGFTDELHV